MRAAGRSFLPVSHGFPMSPEHVFIRLRGASLMLVEDSTAGLQRLPANCPIRHAFRNVRARRCQPRCSDVGSKGVLANRNVLTTSNNFTCRHGSSPSSTHPPRRRVGAFWSRVGLAGGAHRTIRPSTYTTTLPERGGGYMLRTAFRGNCPELSCHGVLLFIG